MEIEKELRGFVSALGPDGFLVVRTRQISALCDEVDRLKAIESAPRKPMTDEQLSRKAQALSVAVVGLSDNHFADGFVSGFRAAERFHQIKE
jgi:hypothetical protein